MSKLEKAAMSVFTLLFSFFAITIYKDHSQAQAKTQQTIAAQPNMRFQLVYYEAHARPDMGWEIWKNVKTGEVFTCTVSNDQRAYNNMNRNCILSGITNKEIQ